MVGFTGTSEQRPPLERSSERFREQNELVEVTQISSKEQILQRTEDRTLNDLPTGQGEMRAVGRSAEDDVSQNPATDCRADR